MKIKIVAIVGPTAVGKSNYAVEYAKNHNGEIISADSRQVYKGMDIGTGKITKDEMSGIPHHLLDIVSPMDHFNVAQYKDFALKAIEDISKRGKLPIICGGTGFYIDAVVNNIEYPNVEHNESLRNSLKEKSVEQLFEKLLEIDNDFAKRLNNSEKNNKQRLIRFIEIGLKLGKIPNTKVNPIFDVKWIGLNTSNENLRKRIHNRLLDRIEMGMINEVSRLSDEGVSHEKLEAFGLEYRYISRYLRNILNKEKMIIELENEIWQYAKRQMVWFKKNKDIEWVEV